MKWLHTTPLYSQTERFGAKILKTKLKNVFITECFDTPDNRCEEIPLYTLYTDDVIINR